MNLLNDFKNKPFIEAVQSFFKNLNVPVNEITTAPSTASDIIGENTINAFINEVFVYGIVDDAIFEQNETFKNLAEVKSLKADYDGILLFGITLHPRENNLLPTRAQLADITRAFSRTFKHTPITIVFKYGNYIAFANSERTQYKQQWREGEKVGKVTILRDVFIDNPHSGHLKILRNLEIKKSGSKIIETFEGLYKHWQEVLNVSVLNKAFYEELVNWYFWAIKKVTFPNEPIQETEENYSDYFERLKAHRAQNVIRLITRLMFTWFIKEKNLVPNELFDQNFLKNNIDFGDKDSSNYYKAILQNLFFATLNQEMGNREFRKDGQNVTITNLYRYKKLFKDENIALKLFKNVPFLNGGLFECLDKGLDKIDGFSERKDCVMIFPNELFFSEEQFENLTEDYGQSGKKYEKAPVKGLINLLNDYVFTVTENTPVEEDVALDPELLGKVFENLLASYNPETKTTARKQTGSFYTPREIVNYMVDESLIAYLKNELLKEVPGYVEFGKSQTNLFGNEAKKGQLSLETKIEENPFKENEDTLDLQLHQLFSYETIQPFNDDKVKKSIIVALDKCKILDPACGSGAYPMGVLHKMVHVLQKLDPDNIHWKELQKQKAIEETQKAFEVGEKEEREARLIEINDAFDEGINDPDYARKLFLIENCIYGVDIQPVAVQISKLRFFISLVVDQKPTQDITKNRGIRPLPNLETKFVAANTLIGLDKPKQLMLRNPEIEKLEKLLADVRHQHFSAKTPKTKEKWRARDKELRNEISHLLIDDGWNTISANQVANWDPYNQNTSSDFFDTEWMFGFENGFDLVIGNPPYVSFYSGQAAKIELELLNKYIMQYDFIINKKGKSRLGTVMMFLEKTQKLLKKDAICTYIIDLNIFSDAYTPIRKYLNDKISIREIIKNLSEFENVGSGQIIFSFCNSRNTNNTINIFSNFSKNELVQVNQSKINEDNDYSYSFSKYINLLNLISEGSRKISDLSYIISGMNIGGVKEHFLSETKIDNTFHKGIFSGNIFRYKIDYPNEVQNRNPRNMFIKFDKKLEAYIWKNKLGTPSIGENDNKFKQNKILIRRPLTSDGSLAAAYSVDFDHYSDVTVYIINKTVLDLEILLGIINSKLATFYCRQSGIIKHDKGQQPQITINNFKEFPIKNDLSNIYQVIAQLVKILNFKYSFTVNDVVDGLVFELYFTDEMKDKNIEIVKFVEEDIKSVLGDKDFEKLSDSEKQNCIDELERRWTSTDNEVRNRIKLFAVRSPDILKPILESK